MCWGSDAEDLHAVLKHLPRDLVQHSSREIKLRVLGRLLLLLLVLPLPLVLVIVEAHDKLLRQPIQKGQHDRRLERLVRGVDDVRVLRQEPQQVRVLLLLQVRVVVDLAERRRRRRRRGVVGRRPELPDRQAEPRVVQLQRGARLALELGHLLAVERVPVAALRLHVLRQEGRDAERLGRREGRPGVLLRRHGVPHRVGALVQHVAQQVRVAQLGRQALHLAKVDVLDLAGHVAPPHQLERLDHAAEVRVLLGVDDVDHPVEPVPLLPVQDRREVPREVHGRARPVADHAGAESLGPVLLEVDEPRAVALFRDALGLEEGLDLADGVRRHLGLARVLVELDAQAGVRLGVVLDIDLSESRRQRHGFRVALLHPLEEGVSLGVDALRLDLGRLVDLGVDVEQVADGVSAELLLGPKPVPADGEQGDVLAPVAQVVQPDDVPPHALVEVGDRGAVDGAAEVSAFELGRNVGRGELDDDLLASTFRRRGIPSSMGFIRAVKLLSIRNEGYEESRKQDRLSCGDSFSLDFETGEDHGQVAHGNGSRRLNRLIGNRGVTLGSLGHDLGDVRPEDVQRAHQHIGHRERGQRSVEAQPLERGLKTGDGESCHNSGLMGF
ncbi:hypothetical protein CTA1_11152 [Colletotrichum tanaceti]|uniref:Uncharacterized protein n=1 Tax=Colletotrichum tanaceti TaxID=1306861 RepID=A0A4U6X0N7_9PEZI|nr:hypothetical protein CTA1_11152 [Colletotrichum tanaceti]